MATVNVYERYRNRNRSNRWQDWIVFLASIWLFFSPWILQFGHNMSAAEGGNAAAPIEALHRAAWDAWVLGVIVFLVSLSAISRMEFWQERWNALLGIWIFIAPWVLSFAGAQLRAAAWDHWIVGAVIFLCAVHNLYQARNQQGQVVGPVT